MAKSKLSQPLSADNGHPVEHVPERPIVPTPDVAPDPFDPASLRVTGVTIGVKKVLTTVPVRKPAQEFVRVHADEAFALPTTLLEVKADREIYLVTPSLRDALATESAMSVRTLFTTINRQGVLFLWPVRLPTPTGRIDPWTRSAMDAAERARTAWIRLQANMSLGAYEVFEATGDLPEPEWPAVSFGDILRIAFRDKRIDTLDHPVLRQLRGEV
jgi:hypothetical protein